MTRQGSCYQGYINPLQVKVTGCSKAAKIGMVGQSAIYHALRAMIAVTLLAVTKLNVKKSSHLKGALQKWNCHQADWVGQYDIVTFP